MASIQVFTGELAGRQHTLTTSRIVARVFGKRHADVLRSVRSLDCSAEFNERNFAPVEYRDTKGEIRQEVQMTRDGFMFLVMGFTGAEAAARKQAFIATFNDMEDRLKPQPATPLEDQMSRLAGHMGHLAQGMDTVLRQMDTQAKYIALLEINQVGKRRVDKEVVREVFTLRAQGMNTHDIAKLCRVPQAAVKSIIEQRYPGLAKDDPRGGSLPEKTLDDILQGMIERGRVRHGLPRLAVEED